MGDPAGAAAHIRQSLAPDGTWMIVEPFARDLSSVPTSVERVSQSSDQVDCSRFGANAAKASSPGQPNVPTPPRHRKGSAVSGSMTTASPATRGRRVWCSAIGLDVWTAIARFHEFATS